MVEHVSAPDLSSVAEALRGLKRCSRCGSVKTVEEFYFYRATGTRRSACIACCRSSDRERRDRDQNDGACSRRGALASGECEARERIGRSTAASATGQGDRSEAPRRSAGRRRLLPPAEPTSDQIGWTKNNPRWRPRTIQIGTRIPSAWWHSSRAPRFSTRPRFTIASPRTGSGRGYRPGGLLDLIRALPVTSRTMSLSRRRARRSLARRCRWTSSRQGAERHRPRLVWPARSASKVWVGETRYDVALRRAPLAEHSVEATLYPAGRRARRLLEPIAALHKWHPRATARS